MFGFGGFDGGFVARFFNLIAPAVVLRRPITTKKKKKEATYSSFFQWHSQIFENAVIDISIATFRKLYSSVLKPLPYSSVSKGLQQFFKNATIGPCAFPMPYSSILKTPLQSLVLQGPKVVFIKRCYRSFFKKYIKKDLQQRFGLTWQRRWWRRLAKMIQLLLLHDFYFLVVVVVFVVVAFVRWRASAEFFQFIFHRKRIILDYFYMMYRKIKQDVRHVV